MKGKYYYKFDDKNNSASKGYPRFINKRWENAPSSISAMFVYGYENKTVIIRSDKYWLIGDDGLIAPGYPQNVNIKFRGLY